MTEPTSAPDAAHRYQCPACGSYMKYGAKRCGACNEESPVYNLPIFWRGLYASIAITLAFAAWAWLN